MGVAGSQPEKPITDEAVREEGPSVSLAINLKNPSGHPCSKHFPKHLNPAN